MRRSAVAFVCTMLVLAMVVAVVTAGTGRAARRAGVARGVAAGGAGTVQLFGHVSLVQGYALPGFTGCHALVGLRDTPGKTVAVLTRDQGLQSLLETGLATGNLVAFWGRLNPSPPTPRGGAWSTDVYDIDGVILYNMK